ncbi:MAG: SRPBCC family protein [candidate division Zixibacteria bacterium]|nr:SRPBCC family protein [candidate division Zixibacteria bacterium]MDH3937059.1 SRPBCC family protein [candidate division Zixibacteria bacterium]MDH4032538.1 SRPBCC family protein [candidate division Zixibacteria bacterium]
MGQTNQSITIQAPVAKVWEAISDFHDASWAPNVITELKPVGDKPGDQVGSKRVLNGVFHETLLTLDNDQYSFSYAITDGPSPLSQDEVDNFTGFVKLSPDGKNGGTQVQWSSSWQKNDEPVHEFCNPIYDALLNDMKKSLE